MNGEIENVCTDGLAWYCARTKPKHESLAEAALRVRLGLEVFNPRLSIERSTRRGVIRCVEPLFPCYIFVRCSLTEFSERIRFANGISSLVRFGDSIPAVEDCAIQELKECFESAGPVEVAERLEIGEEVTVSRGAFLGASGVVVRVLPAKQRVQVLLDFLGRPTIAEVERNNLVSEGQRLADLVPRLSSVTPRQTVQVAA